MKAKIIDKSELRLSDLTREYTFDIVSDDGDDTILSSQVITARPSEVKDRLSQIITDFQAAYEDANDVEVGEAY